MIPVLDDDAAHSKRRLAGFLQIAARHSASPAEFAEVAAAASWIALEDFEWEKLWEPLLAIPDDEVSERAPDDADFSCRINPLDDLDWDAILLDALEQFVEARFADGSVFSANTLRPMLPAHRLYLAGQVIQRMKNGRLEGVGYVTSLTPSRKGALARTYRLRMR